MVSGPSSSVPEFGEGIDARRLTAVAFCLSVRKGGLPVYRRR